jgi:DNA-binding response OmpR family regulator
MDRRFNSASALLYDPQATMRHDTRVALLSVGFGNVEAVSTSDEFIDRANKGAFDLIIGDTKAKGLATNDLVRQIRQNSVGQNPFVNVIVTLWDTSPEMVQSGIQAGADDLISRPMSTQQIASRIGTLVTARKPFVVTEDYVGPERRSILREDALGNLMIVPNSLKAKVENRPDLDATPDNILLALSAINDRKITIYTERFLQYAKKILSLSGDLKDLETRREVVLQMLRMCEDLVKRITGTEHDHILSLVEALAKLLARVAGSVSEMSGQDQQLMFQIPTAIHIACKQARVSSEMAFDIRQLSQEISNNGE